MKINWKALGGLALTGFGLVSSPVVLHVLPAQWAAVVVAVGAVVQAVTDAVHHPAADTAFGPSGK